METSGPTPYSPQPDAPQPTHLSVIAHDVVEAGQETQAGADLHVHGSIYIIEQVQSLIDELTAFFQEAYEAAQVARSGLGKNHSHFPQPTVSRTLLYFGLPTLEEVEGIRSLGVDMLDHRKDVEHVFLSEGRLVAAVEAVLLQQNLGQDPTPKASALDTEGQRLPACGQRLMPQESAFPLPCVLAWKGRAHLDPCFQGDLPQQGYLL